MSCVSGEQHYLFKHGRTRSGEYRCWNMMIQRCTNPARDSYPRYGAIGVKVCDRWLNSFTDFLSDVGPRPSPKHSLDRYPNKNGDYEPDNVRWATAREQANNRTNGVMVKYLGREMTLAEAVRLSGDVVTYDLAHKRLGYGWPMPDVVEFPKGKRTRWKQP